MPAFEVMRVNRAVRNMIREGKVHQLDNVIFSGASEGMRAMDNDLYRLYKEGMIARDDALLYASSRKRWKSACKRPKSVATIQFSSPDT